MLITVNQPVEVNMRRLVYLANLLQGWSSAVCAKEVSVAKESPPIGPLPAERLARKIEPDLTGRPERVQQYVDFFRRELVSDSRLFAFDVVANATGERSVTLTGYIEFPESRKALVDLLTTLGFEVDDRLESLPAESLGEKRFGFVKTPHSLSYDRPRGRRGVVTDCLLGEPLLLLREDSGHLLVHAGEGYLGYVNAEDVHRVDESEFTKRLNGSRVRITSDIEIAKDRIIPAGARLNAVMADGHGIVLKMPTGEQVSVNIKHCEDCREPVETIDAIAASAKKLLGTPYLWGGKTSEGVDCSGLVQTSFSTAGLNLPRDSYQQFYLGRLTATRWHRAGLRRGDTLYFLGRDGKIRHTGLYLGDDQFIQAVTPSVTISSFNPQHENYDEDHDKSFAFAKRLIE
jgi:hypothetical protein